MLKYSQKEVELEVSRVLESGDITHISQIAGIGYSYVDQQLNPNDERKSYLFGALQILCALDDISDERGEAVWKILTRCRELSKKPKAQNKSKRAELMHKVIEELGDVVSVNMNGGTDAEIEKEGFELYEAAKNYFERIKQ